MSEITIFSKSAAKIGDFSMDEEAIALVNCDDTHDRDFLEVVGEEQLHAIKKKSDKWMRFVEINFLIENKLYNIQEGAQKEFFDKPSKSKGYFPGKGA